MKSQTIRHCEEAKPTKQSQTCLPARQGLLRSLRSLAMTFLLIGLSNAVSFPVSADQNFLGKKIVKLGEAVPIFELPSVDGKTVKLSDYHGKVVMLHFWSATCPFVLRYEDRIQEIARDFSAEKVVVLGIDSNANETAHQIAKVAEARKVNYPILIDAGNKIADQFGAITTPHIFILDREGLLAYEGAVDDQGWSEAETVHKTYARNAIKAVLSDQPVPTPKTRTVGCTIKRA